MAKRHPKELTEEIVPRAAVERPFPSENEACERAALEVRRRRKTPTSGLPTDSDDPVRDSTPFANLR